MASFLNPATFLLLVFALFQVFQCRTFCKVPKLNYCILSDVLAYSQLCRHDSLRQMFPVSPIARKPGHLKQLAASTMSLATVSITSKLTDAFPVLFSATTSEQRQYKLLWL